METNHLFKTFGKGKKEIRIETNDCVVYTRVSSAKQMDGLSLEVQMKGANEYVERHKLIVREYFGGTYESAAKDERKEFQRMLAYLKKTKYKISKILVYSLERFSRNDNSIWLSMQLRKLGIEIISTTQPIDTSNPAGVMQQKMLFMFGEMDNQLRRQKCMAGVKEHLIQGEWVTASPVGYDTVKHNKERKIVVNDTGLIIKKMFYWKAKERMPNVEIQKRLKNLGLNYCLRRIGEILTNPFYCGKMVHKALEGEVVDGRHEKVVSESIFLEANNIMAEKKLGLQTKKERSEIALKRFMRCASCNQPMRGYIAKGYDMPYYKCNTPGCKCNRNANKVNNKFADMLEGYKINETYIPLLKEQLYLTFQQHNASLQESEQAISRQLTDIRQKLERLEERFILEELTAELYIKYKGKFEKESEELEAQRANNKIEMSKLEDYIAVSLEFACNLREMWGLGDYTQRQELQNALFEGGIMYDRQKDECRSTGDNEFITEIARISGSFGNFTNANKKNLMLTSVGALRAESRSIARICQFVEFFTWKICESMAFIYVALLPMNILFTYYTNRISKFNKEIDEQNSKFSKIFYSRILLFLLALVLFILYYKTQAVFAYSFAGITVVLFLFLLSMELQLKRKTSFLKNLIKVNEIEIQLIKKDFNGINEGIEFIDKQHHFISDLDIFGRKSIFQILNRTSTYTGRVKLADWLTNPFLDKKKIILRQTAVKELSTKPEWNHEFIALGFQNKEQAKDKEVIEEWLNEKNTFSNLFLKISSILLPVLSVISIALYFTGIINETPFTLLFFTQLFIIGSYTKRINKIHDNLSRKFDSIEKYRQLISLIESETFDSTLLNDLKSIFKKENESASESIKELKKQTDKLDARMNIVVAVLLNGILLWDINVMRRIEKWRNFYKDNFIKWVDAIAEFDAFISLGMYAHNNPDYIFPEVETDYFIIEAENIGHPLLNEKLLIKNNYHISRAPKVDLLTGANMAGKSTFLRTVGVNLTIAMIGAPVCASKYKFSPIHLFTSLRTNDSLQENESFFYAELKRLHLLTEQYEQGKEVFFLLDEILKGTNSKDQHAGSEALIKKILKLNGVGIVATHDVDLSKLSSQFPNQVRNLRFEITIKDDKLNFDYKLSEGVCSTMNASFLMKKMGIVD